MSIVCTARVVVLTCVCMFVTAVYSVRVTLNLKETAVTEETVAINSQPCTLPTSTNNEVQINER